MDRKGLTERVTSGLIVWLLVTIFIQPILGFTWKAIVVVGGLVHQGYVDRIYRDAAFADPEPYARFTLLAVLMMFVLAAGLWAISELKHYPDFAKARRVSFHLWEVVMLTSFLIIFGRLAILDGTSRANESFTQRLMVLAPAVSDIEYKTFKARWAGMQGKADYDALVVAMDKRAVELGVKLPPVQ